MTRPVDPAALETLALTLYGDQGRAVSHPLDLKPPAWKTLTPALRQFWRDEALKLIAEQTPPVAAEPSNPALEAGTRYLTPFEGALIVLLKGLHPESTTPEPPHLRLRDTHTVKVVSESYRLMPKDVAGALAESARRNIPVQGLFGSHLYIDRNGDPIK